MSGPTWRKSSHSSSQGGDCVEIARLTNTVGIRDSKAPQKEHLELNPPVFTGRVGRIKAGELDR
jgi:hypothetical protein